MKKLSIMIMSLLLVLGMAQCKKQAEQQSNEPATPTMEVKVRVESAADKTEISATGVVTWKQGDKLYVVGETQGLLGYLSTNASGDPVTFTGTITALTSAQTLRFYYVGAREFTLDGSGNCTFDISGQDGSLAGIAANNQLMWGKTTSTIAVGTIDFGTITMTSLMSIAHLNINDGGAAVSGPVTVTGGFATSTFNAKTYDGTALTGTAGNITMTFASGTASTNCYLALLPGTQTLKFSADGKEAILAAKEIVANTFYNAGSAVAVETKPDIPEGALPGLFSVSDTKQVYFSKGNLQRVRNGETWDNTCTWKFADHQWETVETENQDVGDNYADASIQTLFGWGDMSGKTSKTNSEYTWTADWGTKIDDKGTWRTLTGDTDGEWFYLLYTRTMKYDKPRYTIKTDGINIDGTTYIGMFIYPDDYNGAEVGTEGTPATWDEIDALGIVFLPAAGYRSGTSVLGVGYFGYYWSSSYLNSDFAYTSYFMETEVYPDNQDVRYGGLSVRLVSEN